MTVPSARVVLLKDTSIHPGLPIRGFFRRVTCAITSVPSSTTIAPSLFVTFCMTAK
ncbi:MAG: hypothetical protein JRF54_09625 [Deltaproteobacteria bacterium]|nr:hypothetical protein [Deltaproteobacteria bacterium]